MAANGRGQSDFSDGPNFAYSKRSVLGYSGRSISV